jgi:Tfp pilus assembly protein PilE
MMHTKRGFTLLMAVLISSVLLSLGYEIYNLAVKEVTLSSSGRESQFAFFAADTGIECALYADSKLDLFATTSTATELDCGSATSTITRQLDGTNYITKFGITLGAGSHTQCVDVVVTREDPKRTRIESFGHNTCNLTSPLRLERAIRVTY